MTKKNNRPMSMKALEKYENMLNYFHNVFEPKMVDTEISRYDYITSFMVDYAKYLAEEENDNDII